MAQALVRACEGVAAAANFLDIYIQAAVISRDNGSLLGSWLSQEYPVSTLQQVQYLLVHLSGSQLGKQVLHLFMSESTECCKHIADHLIQDAL